METVVSAQHPIELSATRNFFVLRCLLTNSILHRAHGLKALDFVFDISSSH
jgi:hypothetical protein